MTGKDKIEKCREIVAEHQADKIDGVLMDSFTASAVVQVYDALNDENKAKLEGVMEDDIVQATKIVWASIGKVKGGLMSGPEFFQTRMGRIFYEVTMPKLAKSAERIATSLEKLDAQGDKDPKRDKEIVAQMAQILFLANEEPEDNSEYLRGQVEMLCSTAELMATKRIDADGLGGQRDAMLALFCDSRTMAKGGDVFAAMVTKFYFKE